ncbi:MAG: hypothetical protein D0530_08110 [Methylococcales bacterium]|nr:MAG: hypothetical protein D0530_08110 [Methylococcales bacterium]
MAIERQVGGIRCGEVLAELSDFLDGELVSERRDQVMAHLQGCDICERFGGVFTMAIQSLRRSGLDDSGEGTLPFERLKARLDHVTQQEQP